MIPPSTQEIRESIENGQWVQAADFILQNRKTKPAELLKVFEKLLVTSQNELEVGDVVRVMRRTIARLEQK